MATPRKKISPDDIEGDGKARPPAMPPPIPETATAAPDPEPEGVPEQPVTRIDAEDLSLDMKDPIIAVVYDAAGEEDVPEPDEMTDLPWLHEALKTAAAEAQAAMARQIRTAYRQGFEEASRLYGAGTLLPDTIRVRSAFEKQAKSYKSDTTVEITSYDGDEVRIMQRVFSMQEEAGRLAKIECDRRWAADQGYGTGKPFPDEAPVRQERIEKAAEKAGDSYKSAAEPNLGAMQKELDEAVEKYAEGLGLGKPDETLPEPPTFPEDPGGDIDDIPF